MPAQLRGLVRGARWVAGPKASSAVPAQQRGAETAAAPPEERHAGGGPAPFAGLPRRQDTSLLLPRFRGLLVDAAGTLLSPSEPAAEVYLRYGKRHGVALSEAEVLARFRAAYNTPWGGSTIRYVGDGRPFWRHIVALSTGSDDPDLFEDIYEYYARGEAWTVSPGAVEALRRLRAAGMRTAIVSNFDSRLRRILEELAITDAFDAVAISAEIGAEKPNPVIFEAACAALDLPPSACVHVGDDRRNDVFGARDAGVWAWLWGADVHNFAEVERRLETGDYLDSLSGV